MQTIPSGLILVRRALHYGGGWIVPLSYEGFRVPKLCVRPCWQDTIASSSRKFVPEHLDGRVRISPVSLKAAVTEIRNVATVDPVTTAELDLILKFATENP
jgi:hypothetical protein